MRVIWKYKIEVSSHWEVMPRGAEILSVQMQDGNICLWAMIDPEEELQIRRNFIVRGTGHEFPYNREKFIGTVQDGNFVWHIFELKE